jgi:SRSO17 transposase
MTAEQIASLGPAFTSYLQAFRSCFQTVNTFEHLRCYCRGLLSDLPRKSVEPIALAAGGAVRTLQEFLTHHRWDHLKMRDHIQRRMAREHLPAPGEASADAVGTVGWIDETSVAKKGDQTPGVQRQYCGASGKIDNSIVTVHLACRCDDFMTLLDSDLFLPEYTWHADRARCHKAHIPDDVVYRSKWKIALEQIDRAKANAIRFDWLTFDEWYGGKPAFLRELDRRGERYVCEVPASFACFPTPPKYHSTQAPFAAKRADNAVRWGKPFRGQPWRKIVLSRETLAPQVWWTRAAQVHLSDEGRPTDRPYWLIVAQNHQTGETKYFVSNAPPKTALTTLLKVAFTRAGVEHVFRLAKTEVGFGHFEGRSYKGLLRHMILCQLVLLFIAEQTDRLRGEKSGPLGIRGAWGGTGGVVDPARRIDDGANGPGAQHPLPPMAGMPLQEIPS